MARRFEFNINTKTLARLRQNGLCACCGEDLTDLEEHAHHVIPNQSVAATTRDFQWLSEVENCVVLCEPCHGRVHENSNFRYGAVAPPSYYPFVHGGNKQLFQAWAMQLGRRTRAVWP
jgi:5-methylcytosine-specific restriction endonuclease McrA